MQWNPELLKPLLECAMLCEHKTQMSEQVGVPFQSTDTRKYGRYLTCFLVLLQFLYKLHVISNHATDSDVM